jgi:hypothetical protein
MLDMYLGLFGKAYFVLYIRAVSRSKCNTGLMKYTI